MVALVDDQDASVVEGRRWHAVRIHNCWYAATGDRGNRVYMHRAIMGNPAGDVDHINHDGLDNRRSNLRVAGRRGLNIANARHLLGACGYRGVTRRTNSANHQRPYVASIKVNGKRKHLGYFADPVSAARAYDAAAREAFGDFAMPNFRDQEAA